MLQLHLFASVQEQVSEHETDLRQVQEKKQQVRWAKPPTAAEMLASRIKLKERLMQLPENEFVKQRPRDTFIYLAEPSSTATMTGKKKRKVIRLGPFQCFGLNGMPLKDREYVLDIMIQNPTYGYHVDLWSGGQQAQAKPKRTVSEATKLKMRKRNAMKRNIKRFGMLADQFIRSEYEQKGWAWGKADDQLWAEEKSKASQPKAKQKKKRKIKKRSTDNDQFLTKL